MRAALTPVHTDSRKDMGGAPEEATAAMVCELEGLADMAAATKASNFGNLADNAGVFPSLHHCSNLAPILSMWLPVMAWPTCCCYCERI